MNPIYLSQTAPAAPFYSRAAIHTPHASKPASPVAAGSTPEAAQALEALMLIRRYFDGEPLDWQEQETLTQLLRPQAEHSVQLHMPSPELKAHAEQHEQLWQTRQVNHQPESKPEPKPISRCQSLGNALRVSLPRSLAFGSFRYLSALSALGLSNTLMAGFALGGSAALLTGAAATGLVVVAGLAFGPAVGDLVYPHAANALERSKRFALSYAPMTLTGLTLLAVALRNPTAVPSASPALKILAAAAASPVGNLMRDTLLQLSSGAIARPVPACRDTGQPLKLSAQQASELNTRKYGLNVAGYMLLGALQYYWLAESLERLGGRSNNQAQSTVSDDQSLGSNMVALTAALITAAGELVSNLSLVYAATEKGHAIAYQPGQWWVEKQVLENGQLKQISVCILQDKLSNLSDTYKLISDNTGMRNAFSSIALAMNAATDYALPAEPTRDAVRSLPPHPAASVPATISIPVESQAHRQWEYLRDSLKLIPSSERGLRELRSLLVENGQKNQLTLGALQRPFTPYVQRMLENSGVDMAQFTGQLAQHLGAIQLSATYGRVGAQFEYEYRDLTESHFRTRSSV